MPSAICARSRAVQLVVRGKSNEKAEQRGWERIFDGVAGEKLARARKRFGGMGLRKCVEEFEEMRGIAVKWEAPAAEQISALGLRASRMVLMNNLIVNFVI